MKRIATRGLKGQQILFTIGALIRPYSVVANAHLVSGSSGVAHA